MRKLEKVISVITVISIGGNSCIAPSSVRGVILDQKQLKSSLVEKEQATCVGIADWRVAEETGFSAGNLQRERLTRDFYDSCMQSGIAKVFND
jgi:hypothetical protein